MHFIIYDLEATCWLGRPPGYVQEVIEIGAIKLNGYGEELSIFNRFVKPVVNPRLSAFCQELTSITQEQINIANTFPTVIEDFQDWIDIWDEDYLLCSWGKFDKTALISDCKLHDMEWEWLENHINVKNQYKEIKGLSKHRGLRKAVEKEGFEFTGTHHRGIDDAANLVKVFNKYLDEWYY